MRRLRCGIDLDDVLVVGHVPSVAARVEATPCSVHTILVRRITDRGHIWYQDSTVKHSGLKVPERFASGSSSTSVASMSGLSGMGTRNGHSCHWNTASQESARRWTRTQEVWLVLRRQTPRAPGNSPRSQTRSNRARIWRNLRRACGDAGVARPLHFRCNR
jgi:hypothetical protein